MILDHFSNKFAMKLGMTIIKIAEEKNWHIAVEVRRLNSPIFLYVADGLSEDKYYWLYRKNNTAIRFGMSTLVLQKKLSNEGVTLYEKYGVEHKEYVAVAGGMPLFTADGLIGSVAVTGRLPIEDHELIVEALELMKKEETYAI
jgi:uncharacterized protein (UPF0303 family)